MITTRIKNKDGKVFVIVKEEDIEFKILMVTPNADGKIVSIAITNAAKAEGYDEAKYNAIISSKINKGIKSNTVRKKLMEVAKEIYSFLTQDEEDTLAEEAETPDSPEVIE